MKKDGEPYTKSVRLCGRGVTLFIYDFHSNIKSLRYFPRRAKDCLNIFREGDLGYY